MNELLKGLNAESRTENFMKTNQSSLDSCVDLFFRIGAMRGSDILPDFSMAFADDQNLATRTALWARDIRQGAGERQIFRDIFKYLIENNPELAIKVCAKIPELGRWDDVLAAHNTTLQEFAFGMVKTALANGDGLCAKWMPRKGKIASALRKYFEMDPKEYRQLLVSLTNVVETKMCNNEWKIIEYQKVPSLAMARYANAFMRHSPVAFKAYIESLKKGEKKINAGAVYPYDIIRTLRMGKTSLANEQWKALPNFCEKSNEKVLAVVDVSGSMCSSVGGTTSAIDVSISLGLYLSERLSGPFKNSFITFSERPQLQRVSGNLFDRYRQMELSNWSMNTDIEAVFYLILDTAVNYKVDPSHMPTMILILSDMEFDQCARGRDTTALEMIKQRYRSAGYKIPKIVFWNIQSRSRTNVPALSKEIDVALVSGFSPSIMKSVLSGKDFGPRGVMLQTILDPRYDY